jgi:hypothetical protein
MTDIVHKPPVRILNKIEMKFFAVTLDEGEACALARVCYIPENATYEQVVNATITCLCEALEHAGLRNSVEYIGGRNFKERRTLQ